MSKHIYNLTLDYNRMSENTVVKLFSISKATTLLDCLQIP